jgi:hypothetical protein
MAAFMFRQGSALTPVDLPLVASQTLLDLSAPRVACVDAANAFAVSGFPRRVRLQSFANVYGASANTVVTVEHVVSTDGGASWTAVPSGASLQSLRAGLVPDDDRTVALRGSADLAVGASYLFGLRLSSSPAIASIGVYCAVQARIVNRNGSTAPF